MVQELKSQGAEVIVALTHLLIAEDRQLAEEVPEIDVILGGHDHDPITWYDDKTFVHKSGQNAYYLTRLDLILDKVEGQDKVHVFPSWNVILNRGFSRDPVIAAKVDDLQRVFHAITSDPIGQLAMGFDTLYSNVRSRETLMGNLIADALLYTYETDISLIPGGIIRGNKFYEKNAILTLRDLLVELPFGNLNVVVEVSGKEILEALENGVSQVEGKAGRFPQVAGMQFVYDSNRSPGSRIYDVQIQGKPLELIKLYKVATVDYAFNGGDGYSMFKGGRVLLSPLKQVTLVSTLAEYLKNMPLIYTTLDNRIIVKGPNYRLDDLSGL